MTCVVNTSSPDIREKNFEKFTKDKFELDLTGTLNA